MEVSEQLVNLKVLKSYCYVLAFDEHYGLAVTNDGIVYFLTLLRAHIRGEFRDNLGRVEDIVSPGL